MKKIIGFVVLLLMSAPVVWSQTPLVTTTILNGKLSLMMPKDFKRATAANRTTIANETILSDETGKINLIYSLSEEGAAPVSDNDIPAYTDVLLSEMKNNKQGYKMLEDGIHLQDGKNIGYLKFISKSFNQKLFTYLFYISVNDKVLSFEFSCPAKQRKRWEITADSIANSLRVNP